MTKSLLRAGRPCLARKTGLAAALSCALLASTCLTSAPAAAQADLPTPPPFRDTDENGVDLTRGSFSLSIPLASIGAGAEGLTLVNHFGSVRGDNWTVRFRRSESGSTATITITLGDRSETFTGARTATSFTSGQGTGATLTKLPADEFGGHEYLYVAADGTETRFDWPSNLVHQGGTSGFCADAQESTCDLLAIATRAPTGRALNYDWRAGGNCTPRTLTNGEIVFDCAHFYRLASATSSSGHGIAFAYQDNSDPVTGLPGQSWYRRTGATLSNAQVSGPAVTATYAYPSATVTEATDMGGRIWRITHDSNQYVTAVRRPGSAADDLTIAYADATSGVVSQVTARRRRDELCAQRFRLHRDDDPHRRAQPADRRRVRPRQGPADLGDRRARPDHDLRI